MLSSEENGTATANIAYNSNGLSSSRPTAWDYNYDNWFYLSNDTAPTLDFTVASNSEDYGVSDVQYAIVTTNKTTMKSGLSDLFIGKDRKSGSAGMPRAASPTGSP